MYNVQLGPIQTIPLFVLIYPINSPESSGRIATLVSESKAGILLYDNITYLRMNNQVRPLNNLEE